MRFYDKVVNEKWARPEDQDSLRRATVISADQVTEYYYALNDKEVWSMRDFPNLAPPFQNFFIETKRATKINSSQWGTREWFQPATAEMMRHEGASERVIEAYQKRCAEEDGKDYRRPVQWGLHMRVISDKKMINNFSNHQFTDMELLDVKWMVYGQLYVDWHRRDETVAFPIWDYIFGIRANGSICETEAEPDAAIGIDGPSPEYRKVAIRGTSLMADGDRTQFFRTLRAEMQNHMNPLFLAVTFMHCKNVEVKQGNPDRKFAKRSAERGRPLCTYKIIDIVPLKRMLRSEGTNEKTGIKMALHRCRGHFKTYTEDKPLLGRATGTFFWAEQLRGSKQKGVIASDYNVEKPE